MEHLSDALPSYHVHVVEEPTRVKRGTIQCEIGERKNLTFITEELETYCFASWEPIVFDAMLLAAAVEFCDRSLRRPPGGWARNIVLTLPVREVGRWSASDVVSTLTSALNYLTGDLWTMEFRSCKHRMEPKRQRELPFPADASAVIPLSDGLDSWSAATLARRDFGAGLMLVRLLSTKVGRKPTDPLLPFTSIPYRVRPRANRQPVSSGRSRGFKFALISGIAAYLAKVNRIIVPESGQGGLGPALLPAGAYPDYRSHPSFTVRMEQFLQALLARPIRYEFPRLWYTKGETLRAAVLLAENQDAWKKTRSCWQDSRQVSINRRRRQCGVCAACMLRRLSVHAAGLTESRETYVWEDLGASTFATGAALSFSKPIKLFRDYAIAGALHMDHLAALRTSPLDQTGLKRHAFQIARSLGKSPIETEVRLRGLLKKHEGEWRSFVNSLGAGSFVIPWARAAA
jgi:hypothetical protein